MDSKTKMAQADFRVRPVSWTQLHSVISRKRKRAFLTMQQLSTSTLLCQTTHRQKDKQIHKTLGIQHESDREIHLSVVRPTISYKSEAHFMMGLMCPVSNACLRARLERCTNVGRVSESAHDVDFWSCDPCWEGIVPQEILQETHISPQEILQETREYRKSETMKQNTPTRKTRMVFVRNILRPPEQTLWLSEIFSKNDTKGIFLARAPLEKTGIPEEVWREHRREKTGDAGGLPYGNTAFQSPQLRRPNSVETCLSKRMCVVSIVSIPLRLRVKRFSWAGLRGSTATSQNRQDRYRKRKSGTWLRCAAPHDTCNAMQCNAMQCNAMQCNATVNGKR